MIFLVTLIAVETKNSNNMNDPIRLEVCPTWVVEQKFDNPSFYLEHFKNLEYRKTHTKMSVNSKILDLPYMSDLKDILTDTINYLIARLDKDTETAGFRFAQSWVNWYDEGERAQVHKHSNSQFSGVCFFNDNTPLIFHQPNPWYDDTHPVNVIANTSSEETFFRTHQNTSYEAKAGSIVIFPSSMLHSSLPATGERFSLAFNTLLTGDFCEDHTLARIVV